MKKTCKTCGEKYTPSEEEAPQTNICNDCLYEQAWEVQEDYENFSDADPGL